MVAPAPPRARLLAARVRRHRARGRPAMTGAKNIVVALGGRWHGAYGVARCPAHGDRNPSLSVSDGADGKVLVKCFAGCDARDIIDALRERRLWPDFLGDIPHHRITREKKETEHRARQNSAVSSSMWKASLDPQGTPVELYLKSRGFNTVPATLRYAPDALHGPTGLRLPCMVAAVTIWPSRGVQAVHRTFLTYGGAKAPVSNDKMMLGPCAGGAVRLAPSSGILLVGE